MRCKIETKALKAALASLGKVVPDKTTIPALRYIHLKVHRAYAIFSATDTEMTMQVNLDAAETEDGEILIPFQMARDFIAAAKAETVMIEVPEPGMVRMFCGRSRVQVMTLDARDLVIHKAPGISPGAHPGLAAALKFCLGVVSDNETRYNMSGPFIGRGGVWGTNGVAIHHVKMDLPFGGGIIPHDAVPVIVGMGDEPKVYVDDKSWFAEGMRVRAWGPTVDGAFPAVERVEVSDREVCIRLPREELSEAASAAAVAAEEWKDGRASRLNFKAGEPMSVSGRSMQAQGLSQTETRCLANAEIVVSSERLRKTLSAIPADVELVVEVGSHQRDGKGLVISFEDGKWAMLMGMRA